MKNMRRSCCRPASIKSHIAFASMCDFIRASKADRRQADSSSFTYNTHKACQKLHLRKKYFSVIIQPTKKLSNSD